MSGGHGLWWLEIVSRRVKTARTNVLARALRDINMAADFESCACVSAVLVESIFLQFSFYFSPIT